MPLDPADSVPSSDHGAAAGAQDPLRPVPDSARTRADLDRIRAGDAAAFERLWLRYQGLLEVLVAGRIRSGLEPALRSRLDAELDDVLQEAALTVLTKLPAFEYRGPGSVLAWMAQIGANVVRDRADYWRAGRRRAAREQPMPESVTTVAGTTIATGFLQYGGPGPQTEYEQRHARRTVAAALAGLPDRDHTIVLWRFFAGAEWAEIATEVGAASAEAVRKEWAVRILPALAITLTRSARADEGS